MVGDIGEELEGNEWDVGLLETLNVYIYICEVLKELKRRRGLFRFLFCVAAGCLFHFWPADPGRRGLYCLVIWYHGE